MVQKIPNEIIDEVRFKVNILDIVGQYVQLKKQGANWFGLCPFHGEKTPSFSVSEEKQIFNCFSCHRGGNVYKFMMDIEGLNFVEAFQRVVELGNVDVDSRYLVKNDAFSKHSSEYARLKDIHTQAAQLYHHVLMNTQIGQGALNYLHERGLDDALIKEFNLGYAPPDRLLMPFFKERNLEEDLLRDSGLFSQHSDGNLSDRFFDRIMFPLRNLTGQIIGFSGRSLHDAADKPKYLNSPETKIFNKREVLFNLDKAKAQMNLQKKVILFEGYMDVLAAYRAGITNGVASMGTSLTEQQIGLLSRFAQTVLICYDGDEAGQKATTRALSLLNNVGNFNIEIVSIPEKLDPDEYLKKYGPKSFQEIINHDNESPMAFYMRYFKLGRNLDNETEQLAYINDILTQLAYVKDEMERSLYLNRLAKQFNLDVVSLQQRLKTFLQQVKLKPEGQKVQLKQQQMTLIAPPKVQTRDRLRKAEELLLYRILHEPGILERISELEDFTFVHDEYRTLYVLAQGYFKIYDTYEPSIFVDTVQVENLQQIVIELETRDYPLEGSIEEINDCLAVITDYDVKLKVQQLEAKMRQASLGEEKKAILVQLQEVLRNKPHLTI